MEEHEIRQLYGRKVKSKLVIDGYRIGLIESENDEILELNVEIDIFNEGDISEDNYKVNVILENLPQEIHISWDKGKADFTFLPRDKIKISTILIIPIFPGEKITALRFSLELPKKQNVKLDGVKTKVHLFYSNEDQEMEIQKLFKNIPGINEN